MTFDMKRLRKTFTYLLTSFIVQFVVVYKLSISFLCAVAPEYSARGRGNAMMRSVGPTSILERDQFLQLPHAVSFS